MDEEMVFPTINLNGSRPIVLAREYHEAARAVEEAHKRMQHLVHGREYQHEGGLASYKLAVEQMQERSKKLIEVYNDLVQIADYCMGHVID